MRIGTRPVSSSTIVAALGYTPVNKAGDTMIGNLAANALATSGGGLTLIDTMLTRDAANTLAQRNGVSSQAFRLYNTFTDGSNYERLSVRWVGNVGVVSTENAGTGSARVLRIGGNSVLDFDDAAGTITAYRNGSSTNTVFNVASTGLTSTALLHTRLTPAINQASGTYTVLDINPTETAIGAGPHYLIRGRIGAGSDVFRVTNAGDIIGNQMILTASGSLIQLGERSDPAAPSANSGYLYARDNGSGKTQLVVRFPTGAVQVIATEP